MKSTYAILFFAKKNAKKKNGKLPLFVRITIRGQQTQISLQLEVSPELWHAKAGRAIGKKLEAIEINQLLDSITAKINNHYKELLLAGEAISTNTLKNAYLGNTVQATSLLSLFKKINDDMEKHIGIDRAQSSFNKYDLTYRRVEEFMQKQYSMRDIQLNQVRHQFIVDFDSFLKIKYRMSENSAGKLVCILKRVIITAKNNGMIQIDPFANFKVKKIRVDKGYLTEHDLSRLIQKKFSCDRLDKVRDIFVFCCFSGLSYIDVFNLTKGHIQTSFDGEKWIMIKRHKTGVLSSIKLLDIPKKIIQKYEGCNEGGRLLPVISNAKLNFYLKEIAILCDVTKRITFHLARHNQISYLLINRILQAKFHKLVTIKKRARCFALLHFPQYPKSDLYTAKVQKHS